MSIRIIQDKLASYHCQSEQEEVNAMKEITQEVALAALARSGFFKTVVFQGGTCLRVLYGLDRFSEDLDFVLREPDRTFDLNPFLKNVQLEFHTYGYDLQIQDRSKVDKAVKQAFLKDTSIGKLLTLEHRRSPRLIIIAIKVKVEVDTNPPLGAGLEQKYLDFPFPFAVTVQDAPSLFASKSHALLCRPYIKGRDWYDFVWYVGRRTPISFTLLSNALDQVGQWENQHVRADKTWYLQQLEKKIRSIDWESAKRDVARFLRSPQLESIDLWSLDFFLDRLKKLESYL